jgi:hypothetical protein
MAAFPRLAPWGYYLAPLSGAAATRFFKMMGILLLEPGKMKDNKEDCERIEVYNG